MYIDQTISTFRGWIFRLVLLFSLTLGSAGCASIISRAATSQAASAVSECQADKVPVTGVHWFKDAGGAWRVVGVITNNSSQAVSKLVTGVETRTKFDQAADQGEDISAYPLNLQPGQQAPYTAWIDRSIPGLDYFEVEVNECVLTEPAERGQVVVRAGRLVVDEAGAAQVTAELFNPGTKSLLVNGLMAAVYDQAGVLVTADYVDVATRYLAPGESGPVRASLDLPPGAASQIKSYKLFMDALVNQPAPLPLTVPRNVQILTHYTDRDGHFHLVGQITNPGAKGLMTSLQATIYADSTKSQVVDAAEFTTWLPLMPGETLPFDLANWGSLNATRDLWDQLVGKNAVIDLRIEPFLTWTSDAKVMELSLVDGHESINDQKAHFTGKVKNGSNSITSGLVSAVIRQKSSGQIVATGSVQLGITDSAAPGQLLDYSIFLPLPVNTDLATVSTEVTAKGYQP